MLDAVRICGRWISKPLLERLTVRTLGSNPPTRQALLKEFCRRTHWFNRLGQPCLSSASVAIQRLEKQGLVRFPPPAPRAARSSKRKLLTNGQPLPPLPKLPGSAEQIADLHLSLITDDQDPQHWVWNAIISREHPLKDAPLVGAQLRYLILAGSQVVGAFGFGPASFYLSSRDCWIGWDAQAMEQNRQKVIGLSRFLIRPGLRCANLASRCYRLALEQVRADWMQRYGITPVLVETYVDRSTQNGKSLAAANWLRIGQSQGRGRTSPSQSCRSKSIKDVWVWQWDSQARALLQERKLPRVVPRSIFAPSQENTWTEEELDGLELGHVKLEARFTAMLQARWTHPNWSFYTSFPDSRQAIAAYDFVQSKRVELEFANLLAPHQNSTRRRMAAESMVLLAQDTTALSYNTLKQTQGLGPIGDNRNPGRGLLLHTLQAFRLDRIPLGCAWAEVWARDAVSDTTKRNEQSIDQKESGRWVDAYQAAAAAAAQMPQTQILVCGDRESDIIDLYDRSEVAPANLYFLVRAQHDRNLASGQKLWDFLSSQPAGGIMEVQIPRSKKRPARQAKLELRWAQVQILPPRVGCKNSWSPLTLYALSAQEINPPQDAEPIDWMLLTDWKVDSLKAGRRMVRWYGLRWGIECWHQVLKDVCGVETRQMKSAQALKRSLALDLIVAWRVLLLCRLGKEHPHLPAYLLYSPEELAILEVLKNNLRLPEGFPTEDLGGPPAPESNPQPLLPNSSSQVALLGLAKVKSALTLFQANVLVAMLGGFWARKADGHPGPDLLERGLMILHKLVEWERIKKADAQKRSVAKEPRGKPG